MPRTLTLALALPLLTAATAARSDDRRADRLTAAGPAEVNTNEFIHAD